jgi:hypothetical protein
MVEEIKMMNWKINLKNGASIDLNVKSGDPFDVAVTEWVGLLSKGKSKFFSGTFENRMVWISPAEFVMAVRGPFTPPPAQHTSKVEEFSQVDEAVVETV